MDLMWDGRDFDPDICKEAFSPYGEGKAVVGTWSIADACEWPGGALHEPAFRVRSSGWAWATEAWGWHADGLPV